MILARMSRPARVLAYSVFAIAVAAVCAACGTQKISVPKSDPTYAGAVLFNQRCSGCHTLAFAATHGSASNIRTREIVNGPNFNVRCERPVARVLYAIENGGFSGAIMPQNIVVGTQAQEVASFVAHYAGRSARSPRPDGSGSAANGFHCTSAATGSGASATPASTGTQTGTQTTGNGQG
jgi:mono/diheme cytochrome c family protein